MSLVLIPALDLILVLRWNHLFIILKSTAYFMSSQLEFTGADLRVSSVWISKQPFLSILCPLADEPWARLFDLQVFKILVIISINVNYPKC